MVVRSGSELPTFEVERWNQLDCPDMAEDGCEFEKLAGREIDRQAAGKCMHYFYECMHTTFLVNLLPLHKRTHIHKRTPLNFGLWLFYFAKKP